MNGLDSAADNSQSGARVLTRIALGLAGILAVAVVLIIVLVDFFVVAGESMEPNLPRDSRIATWSGGSIDRGDIVVYSPPEGFTGAAETLVQRVVALGGETISFENDQVFIDGVPLDEPYLAEGMTTAVGAGTPDITLRADELYVLGDNRVASADSRFFGPISVSSVEANNVWKWRSG